MHRALGIDGEPLGDQIQRCGGIRREVKVQIVDIKILARHVCQHMLHLCMIVHVHLFRRQEVRYPELVLRLRLHLQVFVQHRDRQMQVSGHGFIGQLGIKHQAGNVDVVIDAIGQVHGHFALHCGGLRIYSFALRMNYASQFHVVTLI